jgi:hypothetical protein
MGASVIAIHGCCKHATPKESVETESLEAAMAVGASPDQVRTAYYGCSLNQAVIRGGHRAQLPPGCEQPMLTQEHAEHMDDDWDEAIRELLIDPANATRIARAGLEVPPVVNAIGPEHLYPPTTKWSDVHVYLSSGHEPHGKEAVWQALAPQFENLHGGYVLIAHSLGSIIAAYLLSNRFIPPPSVLVTVGSQLGWSALVTKGWLSPFHLEGTWINIIDHKDWGAGVFTRDATPKDNSYTATDYRDIWVQNENSANPHDFRGYMRTEAARANVQPFIAVAG